MIERISIAFPSQSLSNATLAELFPGWTAEKIFQKTGINNRYVAGPDECASDLAQRAAEAIFTHETRNEVGFLIYCTQSPDYILPTTACVLQHKLCLPKSCGAFDFNLGCSGYVYGLALAQSLIQSKMAANIVLLTGDTYTKFIHPLDKSTRTIFGDAGTASLLNAGSKRKLHSFVFGTDGSGAEQIMVKSGGLRFPRGELPEPLQTDDSGNVQSANCLHMNGPEVFNFTVRVVPELIDQVLGKACLNRADIDLYVFHQANAFMLNHLRRKLNVPEEKFVLFLEECGNTVSSTIPIALANVIENGRLKPGMRVLLAGFGVGLSWAGCILEWN